MKNDKVFTPVDLVKKIIPNFVEILNNLQDDNSRNLLMPLSSGHASPVYALALCENKSYLYSGDKSGEVKVWDLGPTKNIYTFNAHSGAVRTLVVDNEYLYSGSADGSIKQWDISKLEQSEVKFTEFKHEDSNILADEDKKGIYTLAIDSSRKVLYSGGNNDVINIWDTSSGKSIGTIGTIDDMHSKYVETLMIGLDGYLYSAGHNGEIAVWDKNSKNKTPLKVLHHNGSSEMIYALAMDSNQVLYSAGYQDRKIKAWNVKTGQLIRVLGEHKFPILSLTSSAEGWLLSGDHEGKIKIWDTRNIVNSKEKQIYMGDLRSPYEYVSALAIGKDGQLYSAGGGDFQIMVWSEIMNLKKLKITQRTDIKDEASLDKSILDKSITISLDKIQIGKPEAFKFIMYWTCLSPQNLPRSLALKLIPLVHSNNASRDHEELLDSIVKYFSQHSLAGKDETSTNEVHYVMHGLQYKVLVQTLTVSENKSNYLEKAANLLITEATALIKSKLNHTSTALESFSINIKALIENISKHINIKPSETLCQHVLELRLLLTVLYQYTQTLPQQEQLLLDSIKWCEDLKQYHFNYYYSSLFYAHLSQTYLSQGNYNASFDCLTVTRKQSYLGSAIKAPSPPLNLELTTLLTRYLRSCSPSASCDLSSFSFSDKEHKRLLNAAQHNNQPLVVITKQGTFHCSPNDLKLPELPNTHKPIQLFDAAKVKSVLMTNQLQALSIDKLTAPGSYSQLSSIDIGKPITASVLLSDVLIAIGFSNGKIEIWNLQSKSLAKTLTGHTDHIYDLLILHDGRLVSASRDKTIKFWQPDTGECDQCLTEHQDAVRTLTLMPDDTLVSGSHDKTIKLWDMETYYCKHTFKTNTSVFVSVALPNLCLATGHDGDNTIELWDLKTRSHQKTLKGHRHSIRTLIASSDGKLISGSDENAIKCWDLQTGSCTTTLTGYNRVVHGLAMIGPLEFSAQSLALMGPLLFSADTNAQIIVWDLNSQKYLLAWANHTKAINTLTLHPNGTLISGSKDGTLKLWDTAPHLIKDTDILELLTALRDNTSVTELNLAGLKRTTQGTVGFISLLEQVILKHPSLEKLDLTDIEFTYEEQQLLTKVTNTRPELKLIWDIDNEFLTGLSYGDWTNRFVAISAAYVNANIRSAFHQSCMRRCLTSERELLPLAAATSVLFGLLKQTPAPGETTLLKQALTKIILDNKQLEDSLPTIPCRETETLSYFLKCSVTETKVLAMLYFHQSPDLANNTNEEMLTDLADVINILLKHSNLRYQTLAAETQTKIEAAKEAHKANEERNQTHLAATQLSLSNHIAYQHLKDFYQSQISLYKPLGVTLNFEHMYFNASSIARAANTSKKLPLQPNLNDIFKNNSARPPKVALVGPPGSGKSTLFYALLQTWIAPAKKTDPSPFQSVFFISMRHLTEARYPHNEIHEQGDWIAQLTYIILRECYPSFNTNIDQQLLQDFLHQALVDHPRGVLFMIDGFNELPNSAHRTPTHLQTLIEKLLHDPRYAVLVNSRPHFAETMRLDTVYTLNPLLPTQVEQAITNFFGSQSQQAQSVHILLRNQPTLANLLTCPLYLNLMCQAVDKLNIDRLKSQKALSLQLHHAFVSSVLDFFRPEAQSAIKKVLQKVAFEALAQNRLVFQLSATHELFSLLKVNTATPLPLPILRNLNETANKKVTLSFTLHSFHEYLAACHLAEQIKKPAIQTFIQQHKFDPRYQSLLLLSTAYCALHHEATLNDLFKLLLSPPRDVHGEYSALLLVQCTLTLASEQLQRLPCYQALLRVICPWIDLKLSEFSSHETSSCYAPLWLALQHHPLLESSAVQTLFQKHAESLSPQQQQNYNGLLKSLGLAQTSNEEETLEASPGVQPTATLSQTATPSATSTSLLQQESTEAASSTSYKNSENKVRNSSTQHMPEKIMTSTEKSTGDALAFHNPEEMLAKINEAVNQYDENLQVKKLGEFREGLTSLALHKKAFGKFTDSKVIMQVMHITLDLIHTKAQFNSAQPHDFTKPLKCSMVLNTALNTLGQFELEKISDSKEKHILTHDIKNTFRVFIKDCEQNPKSGTSDRLKAILWVLFNKTNFTLYYDEDIQACLFSLLGASNQINPTETMKMKLLVLHHLYENLNAEELQHYKIVDCLQTQFYRHLDANGPQALRAAAKASNRIANYYAWLLNQTVPNITTHQKALSYCHFYYLILAKALHRTSDVIQHLIAFQKDDQIDLTLKEDALFHLSNQSLASALAILPMEALEYLFTHQEALTSTSLHSLFCQIDDTNAKRYFCFLMKLLVSRDYVLYATDSYSEYTVIEQGVLRTFTAHYEPLKNFLESGKLSNIHFIAGVKATTSITAMKPYIQRIPTRRRHSHPLFASRQQWCALFTQYTDLTCQQVSLAQDSQPTTALHASTTFFNTPNTQSDLISSTFDRIDLRKTVPIFPAQAINHMDYQGLIITLITMLYPCNIPPYISKRELDAIKEKYNLTDIETELYKKSSTRARAKIRTLATERETLIREQALLSQADNIETDEAMFDMLIATLKEESADMDEDTLAEIRQQIQEDDEFSNALYDALENEPDLRVLLFVNQYDMDNSATLF